MLFLAKMKTQANNEKIQGYLINANISYETLDRSMCDINGKVINRPGRTRLSLEIELDGGVSQIDIHNSCFEIHDGHVSIEEMLPERIDGK